MLITQRSASMPLPFKWEFPGGKIEAGESAEECLIREIREELGIDIQIRETLPANEHQYPDKLIRLIPFICSQTAGEIYLKEHAEYRWQNAEALLEVDWAEADLPIVKHYLEKVLSGSEDQL